MIYKLYNNITVKKNFFGELDKLKIKWAKKFACCIVLASAGYPASSHKGDVIYGLEKAQKNKDVIAFHFATKKDIKASLKIYNRDINEKFTNLLKSVMADPSKIESLKDAAKILDTVILFAYQNNA